MCWYLQVADPGYWCDLGVWACGYECKECEYQVLSAGATTVSVCTLCLAGTYSSVAGGHGLLLPVGVHVTVWLNGTNMQFSFNTRQPSTELSPPALTSSCRASPARYFDLTRTQKSPGRLIIFTLHLQV
jgi:hypothetical protein